MLTDEDIQKLVDAFATKNELVSLKDEIVQEFHKLEIAIDAYAKRAETVFQELLMLSNRVNRLEKWIRNLFCCKQHALGNG